MRIDIRMEGRGRIVLPIPNALVRLLGPALLRHADLGKLSAGQCRELIDGLLRCRKALRGKPLACIERAEKGQKVTVWL